MKTRLWTDRITFASGKMAVSNLAQPVSNSPLPVKLALWTPSLSESLVILSLAFRPENTGVVAEVTGCHQSTVYRALQKLASNGILNIRNVVLGHPHGSTTTITVIDNILLDGYLREKAMMVVSTRPDYQDRYAKMMARFRTKKQSKTHRA